MVNNINIYTCTQLNSIVNSDKVKKVQSKSNTLTKALNSELVDFAKQKDDKQFEKRKETYAKALDLDFII